jgi:hypothetical protein
VLLALSHQGLLTSEKPLVALSHWHGSSQQQ